MTDARLIERWLPIAALGEESVRERRSMTALPPTYYLHVWWARRPLVASRAAVLASILPADANRDDFLQALGIHGDPVATRREIDRAKKSGADLGEDPYGYARAFKHVPSESDRAAIAGRDYQERMARIFRECKRVLKRNGVMTLMFTHKATGAWDALTSGLMQAGFSISASWPINTEAEGSLHIKNRSAANSTIFLVCRSRQQVTGVGTSDYWEEVEPLVANAVRNRVKDFQQAGIGGVDLYLACFGPALEEFSRHWPLKRGTPRAKPEQIRRRRQSELFEDEWDPYAVTPEDALNAARREVKNWRLEQLTHMKANAEVDPLTAWFVLAWDAFKAPVFPYDEALRLARAVGVDLDTQVVGVLAAKDGSDLVLWDSAMRAAKSALGSPDGSRAMIDAVHHAAHMGRTRTLQAARELLAKAGVDREPAFFSALEAVLEVLPISKAFTGIDLEGDVASASGDFETLENLRKLAFAKQVDQPRQLEEQLEFWKDAASA